MAVSQFDSSRMFPLFQMISPNGKFDMRTEEARQCGRPEESVHRPHRQHGSEIAIRKPAEGKQKSKHDAQREDEVKAKPSRKQLLKQNEHTMIENQKLTEQLSFLHQTLNKKVLRLKEKLNAVQSFNKEVLQENDAIKTQCHNLTTNIEEYKAQLAAKQGCSDCEEMKKLAKKINAELGTTKMSNKQLNEDLNMLKNVVYRLNVQLGRYQQKLRKADASEAPPDVFGSQAALHADHMHSPLSWGDVHRHTLGPLLDAYQDAIADKEDAVRGYELELTGFTDKLRAVLEENEALHSRTVDEASALARCRAEQESAAAELRLTRDQNDLLIKKCALKHDKLQEIVKVYDHKVSSMRLEYEVLQEQLHKTKCEHDSLHVKYRSLLETHEATMASRQELIPLAVHTAGVSECKRLFEELKAQYEGEKVKFTAQTRHLEEQLAASERQLADTGAERKELQLRARTAEKQLKRAEGKLSEASDSLTHAQIARDACKRQLGRAVQFGRELVTEQESLVRQLSSRQRETAAARQLESAVAGKMDVLKARLKAVQKDAVQELQTVEQRIQEQDDSIEAMRREHEAEVAQLLRDIQQKDECIAKLVDQSDLLPTYLLCRNKHA